jgi:putative transposase
VTGDGYRGRAGANQSAAAERANAMCERFVSSVRRECLDHRLIFGERQLDRVIHASVDDFNRSRPHPGIGQNVPCGPPRGCVEARAGKLMIMRFPVLNGLQHDYRRAA